MKLTLLQARQKSPSGIFDGSKSLAIELKDNSELEFEKAIGSATFSNSKPTVASYLSFFEKLWHESESERIGDAG